MNIWAAAQGPARSGSLLSARRARQWRLVDRDAVRAGRIVQQSGRHRLPALLARARIGERLPGAVRAPVRRRERQRPLRQQPRRELRRRTVSRMGPIVRSKRRVHSRSRSHSSLSAVPGGGPCAPRTRRVSTIAMRHASPTRVTRRRYGAACGYEGRHLRSEPLHEVPRRATVPIRAMTTGSTTPAIRARASPKRGAFPSSTATATERSRAYAFNLVTFVYMQPAADVAADVSVIGTFGRCTRPSRCRASAARAWTERCRSCRRARSILQVPDRRAAVLDPVNPQRVTHADGSEWSRFFTEYCTDRYRSNGGRWRSCSASPTTSCRSAPSVRQRFLRLYYDCVDRQSKDTQYARAYRLDQPVGAVNFIDKIVAREEAHRLRRLQDLSRAHRSRPAPAQSVRGAVVHAAGNVPDLYDQMATTMATACRAGITRGIRVRVSFCRCCDATHTPAPSHIPSTAATPGRLAGRISRDNLINPQTGALPTTRRSPAVRLEPRRSSGRSGRNPEYRG